VNGRDWDSQRGHCITISRASRAGYAGRAAAACRSIAAMPSHPHGPFRRRPRQPKPDRRRALELLASAGAEGCTEAVMLANGIDVDTMVQIIV
jgi:hypothetical protein